MAIAKLILNNATQMDLTADTVTSSDHIMEGYVGHLRNGTSVTGTGKIAASEQAALDALVRYSNEVTGESDTTISEAVETLVGGYKSKSFWVKPDDWPDIESIALPGSDTTNTVYLLYDKTCGDSDLVSFSADTKMTVSKGNIENNIFIGNEVATSVTSYTDTLSERFTIYKIVNGKNLAFKKGITNNYTSSIQSLVWIYGEIPQNTQSGSSTEGSAGIAVHTQRVKYVNAIQLTSLTLSGVIDDTLKSYEIGCANAFDFSGRVATSAIGRGGNGPMFYKHPNDEEVLHIKNISLNPTMGRPFRAQNILFENVTLPLANQRFQDCKDLRTLNFLNSTVTCTDMYYQFSGCSHLESCDLSIVDFSTCTRSGNAFQSCGNLKNLKLNNTWKMSLNISACYSITKESVLGIFNVLPILSEEESFTITLPYAMKNYLLTEEEKAIVTNKGWAIA